MPRQLVSTLVRMAAVPLAFGLTGQMTAQAPVVVSGKPPARSIEFKADPNPIVFAPGNALGKTTLRWNAPGYTHLVVRVAGRDMTGKLPASGSVETGEWVAGGTVFTLVDALSGRSLASVTVGAQGGGPPRLAP